MATLDLKQLEGKPWYYGLGIGLVIAVALYLAAYYQLPNFSEMKQTLENRKNELDQLNQKITQGRAAERRLPQLREEVRRTELDLQRLLQILPTARNAEELIKKIQALAGQGEFFLKKWAPKEYINKDFYAEWPIDLQVDGTYHNLALFFEKVARFSRIINIEDLVMVGYPDAAGGRTLGANFTMKTFIYLGDTEAAAAAAASPAAAPGKKPAGAGGPPKKESME
jgi:type IV pilus assembly protein PilO